MTVAWWTGPLAGLDFETTGKDPIEARAVTASVVVDIPGQPPVVHDWLVKVEIEIPEEAIAKHGVTNERAQAEGEPVGKVITELTGLLVALWEDQTPVVIYNAPYDLTVLNQERYRLGMAPLDLHPDRHPILDSLVIDRRMDKFRKGSRQLGEVCKFYGVVLEDAHTSAADSLAAVQVARCLGEKYPWKLNIPMGLLTRLQRTWYGEWASNFEGYLRGCKVRDQEPPDVIDSVRINREWPVQKAHLTEQVGSW